jgi:hypothetical protein
MKVERTGPSAFVVDFDDEAELRAEQQANFAAGGLYLKTPEVLAPFAEIDVRLRLPGRGETTVKARVVGTLPQALALQIQGACTGILPALLTLPVPAAPASAVDSAESAEGVNPDDLWKRVQAMTPPQKMRLAPKADRATRALLLLDSEPMLLFALLKNPRLGAEEVVRIAKSPSLGFQAAELILKTQPWNGNTDVLVALIHNPKLPLHLGLRILPMLPNKEVRVISKGAATSAGLKQAALRRLTSQ